MSKDHTWKLEGPARQLDSVLDCGEEMLELIGIAAELKIKELFKGSLGKAVATLQDGPASSHMMCSA